MNIREDKCLTYEDFKEYFEAYINEETKDRQIVLNHIQMNAHIRKCEKCKKISKDLHKELWNADGVDVFCQKFDEYLNNNVEVLGDDSKPKSR